MHAKKLKTICNESFSPYNKPKLYYDQEPTHNEYMKILASPIKGENFERSRNFDSIYVDKLKYSDTNQSTPFPSNRAVTNEHETFEQKQP